MERVRFNIMPDDGAMLEHEESKIKYTDGFRHGGNRSTRIEYIPVDGSKIPVIRYKIFDAYPELVHGFSTRFGGVSTKHLSTMNLSFSRGDIRDNVMENHRRFGAAAGYDYRRLVFSDQVHDVQIHVASEEDAGKGIMTDSDIKGIDGLVTDVRMLPLITFYADCVPLYFYDPVQHVIGLAHSGWRGTVGNIAAEMLRKMKAVYGCRVQDIRCAIGPSICMHCYEVSEDVADRFRQAYKASQFSEMIYDKGNGKYQLDLHKACRYNLTGAGVSDGHIAMPDLCTCCNPNILYSHRASNGMRGNLAAVIMLSA